MRTSPDALLDKPDDMFDRDVEWMELTGSRLTSGQERPSGSSPAGAARARPSSTGSVTPEGLLAAADQVLTSPGQ